MKVVAFQLACWLGLLSCLASCAAAEPDAEVECASTADSPRSAPPFVPVHVQIGTDGIERTVDKVSKPAAVPAAPVVPDNLFGTWHDLRPALVHDGITPTVIYIADLAGNPVGGQRRGFTDADETSINLDVNLERLCGLTGAKGSVSLITRSGSSLTDDYIDNLFQVQQEFGGSTWHLTNLYFDQALDNDRFSIRVGRLVAGDEFLTSPYASLFMQSSINGNPQGILFDAPGMTTPPIATWGARFLYKPLEEVSIMTGLYDGNPNVALNSMNGLDFTMRGPLFWISELCYAPQTRKGANGLPGHYKVGIWYNDGSFEVFQPFTGLGPEELEVARKLRLDRFLPEGSLKHQWGDWGFYAMMDQVLWKQGKTEVGIFGALLVAPNQQINQMPLFADGGIVWRGPLPSRSLDVVGFQISGGTISSSLRRAQRLDQMIDPVAPVQTFEMVLEGIYSIHVTHGLLIQPDVQCIINPGAAAQYPNALVLGVQVSITF
jgi:porin